MHRPTDIITHTTAFCTPVVEHWLERETAQWVHHEAILTKSSYILYVKTILKTINILVESHVYYYYYFLIIIIFKFLFHI